MKYMGLMGKQIVDIVESDMAPIYPPTPDGNIIKTVLVPEGIYPKLGLCFNGEYLYDENTGDTVTTTDTDELEEITKQPTQLDRLEANIDYLVLLNS